MVGFDGCFIFQKVASSPQFCFAPASKNEAVSRDIKMSEACSISLDHQGSLDLFYDIGVVLFDQISGTLGKLYYKSYWFNLRTGCHSLTS